MHDATKGKAWDKSEHLYFNVPNVKPLPMQWFLFCELTFSGGGSKLGVSLRVALLEPVFVDQRRHALVISQQIILIVVANTPILKRRRV